MDFSIYITLKPETPFLFLQSCNIMVMKTLAGLGANLHLPPIDDMPFLRPFLLPTAASQPTRPPTNDSKPGYMHVQTHADSEISGWTTGYFGDGTIGYDTSSRATPSSHRTECEDIVTLLREVGAIPKGTNCTTHHSKGKKSGQARGQGPSPSLYQPNHCQHRSTSGPAVEEKCHESVDDQQRRGVRVLCLDGGGVRGLLQIEILRQLEERLAARKKTITSFFDYIVGTSTGGIIALALVYGRYRALHCNAVLLHV